MKKNGLIIGLLTAMTVTACGSTAPAALPTYPDVNISSLPGVPDDLGDVRSSKLLVAAGTKINIPKHLQEAFAENIREFVIDSGSEVIDRDLAQRFINEIQLNENLSEDYEEYEGPVEAKFVVIPTITNYSWSSEYDKAYTSTTKKGKTIRHDAKCRYKGNAKGNIQIRSLPSMKQMLSVNVSSSASSSQDNPSSKSCKEDSFINGVINKSIGKMLSKGDDNYVTLSKYVGSQGIITAAKEVKGKLYFETNLGRLHGAKADKPVAIYQEVEGELVKIATGEMVDKDNIYTRKSFIVVDSDVQSRIKRGMIVMLSGECASMLCSIGTNVNSAMKSMTN